MTRYQIGRGEENHIVIRHPSVSRVHAVLDKLQDGQYLLSDLSSTYGTGIERNGNWVQIQKAVITAGDKVRFGDQAMPLSVLLERAEQPARAPPRHNATTLLAPVAGSPRGLLLAGAASIAAVAAGAAIWFGLGAAQSSTRQAFLAECVARGYTPATCQCHAKVLNGRLNDSELRVYTAHMRDRTAPPGPIIAKLLPAAASIYACGQR